MDLLVLKLLLVPAIIGGASLAGRRWGPAVSGWIVGLPLTSGPVAFFVALTHGTAFAAGTALGTLAGALSLAAYCLAYSWLARRWRWPFTITLSGLLFFLFTLTLQFVMVPLGPLFVIGVAALLLALRLMPGGNGMALEASSAPLPLWDIPVRMGLATAFVLLLTGVAPLFGPRLTGLLGTFPLYTTILTVFAHQQQGPAAAARLLRGLLLGLFSFVGFYLALGVWLETAGITVAFALAIGVGLVIQAGTLVMLRRAQR